MVNFAQKYVLFFVMFNKTRTIEVRVAILEVYKKQRTRCTLFMERRPSIPMVFFVAPPRIELGSRV